MFAVYTLAKYTLNNITKYTSVTYCKNTSLKQLVNAKHQIPTYPKQLFELKIQQFIKAICLKETIWPPLKVD